jgi:hypothetical protein
MNERNLEARMMGQQAQANVQDVLVTLAPSEIVEEQVQAGVDVGETFAIDVNGIKVDLEKTILMIE